MPHDHKGNLFDVGTTVRTRVGGIVYKVCGYAVADRSLSRTIAQTIANLADGKPVRCVHYWHEVEVADGPADVLTVFSSIQPMTAAFGPSDQQILWGD